LTWTSEVSFTEGCFIPSPQSGSLVKTWRHHRIVICSADGRWSPRWTASSKQWSSGQSSESWSPAREFDSQAEAVHEALENGLIRATPKVFIIIIRNYKKRKP
jgi:hypothetical protein